MAHTLTQPTTRLDTVRFGLYVIRFTGGAEEI